MIPDVLPVLYSFRRCPYAIRARLALHYACVPVIVREVVLKNKPAEMLAISPKGTVPVLQLEREHGALEIIDESIDIMSWALAQHDPDGWLDIDIGEASQLIEANDEQFKPWLDRYKYPARYSDMDSDEPREQCCRFLDELQRRLRMQRFLCASRATLADYAIYSFVRQFAYVDIEWFRASAYTELNVWLQQFLDSALFAAVMHKYPQWHSGDEQIVFS